MKTRIYKINLRGYMVDTYKQNPLVMEGFDYTKFPIGKATILKGKTKVKIEYFNDIPKYPHTIGTGEYQYVNRPKDLMALAVIPVLRTKKPSKQTGNIIRGFL